MEGGMHLHYVAMKRVKGRPMTRQEYNDYRGWTLPADENGDDIGYLVEDEAGAKPNHPDHTGYISWSPAAQFDSAYYPMAFVGALKPYEEHLTGEFVLTFRRAGELYEHMESPIFAALPPHEQRLVRSHHYALCLLADILEMRVDDTRSFDDQ